MAQEEAPAKVAEATQAEPKAVPQSTQEWLLHYGFGASEPDDAGAVLSTVVERLKAPPDARVTIAGYADNSSPE